MSKKASSKAKFPAEWRLKNGVYVHPNDKRKFPRPITLIPPQDYEYASKDKDCPPNPWGFVTEDDGGLEALMATMMSQSDDIQYMHFATPIQQFVDVLVQKKRAKIKAAPVSAVVDRFFVVKITMPLIDDQLVYRLVELPAWISLSVLHDKVLSAVMGWARGYHGYVFLDDTDGSVLGPKTNSGYIDMMHAKMHYHAIGDDRRFPLASLINQVGDKCLYTYDLGDQFDHVIELVEIKEQGYQPESNVTILEGKGACPPEDSNGLEEKGSPSYKDFLDKYQKNPQSCAGMIRDVEKTAVNYRSHWLGGSIPFRPLEYDLSFHQRVLDLMVDGPNCIKPADFLHGGIDVVETYTACDSCGDSLKVLQKCAACKQTRYCSKQCQREHWKEHKVECRSSA